MKNNLKKLLSVFLCAVILFTTASTAFAADEPARAVVDSGFCGAQGENLTWTLYDDGELVISGEGEMDWYSSFENEYSKPLSPWHSYYNRISVITVSEGVTSIGENAFTVSDPAFCKISLPRSLEYIEEDLLDITAYNSERKTLIVVSFAADPGSWNSVHRKNYTYIYSNGILVRDNSTRQKQDILKTKKEIVELYFNGTEPEPFCKIMLDTGLPGANGPLVMGIGKVFIDKYYPSAPDCKIVWSIEGDTGIINGKPDAFGFETSASVYGLISGWSTVTAKIIGSDGNVIVSDDLMLGALTEFDVKENSGIIMLTAAFLSLFSVSSVLSIILLPITGPFLLLYELFG